MWFRNHEQIHIHVNIIVYLVYLLILVKLQENWFDSNFVFCKARKRKKMWVPVVQVVDAVFQMYLSVILDC